VEWQVFLVRARSMVVMVVDVVEVVVVSVSMTRRREAAER
jgi:hypothetical protein